MNFTSILHSYLRAHIKSILVILVSSGIFIIIFWLYNIPFGAYGYALLLSSVFIILSALYDFVMYFRKHSILEKLKNNIAVTEFSLPESNELIEKDYQELIKIIDDHLKDFTNEKEKALTDMVDYYTIWVHQIKTPIAAMQLLLQSEQSDNYNELLEQLFKIEQYAEMVLQYLRMESMNSDLLIKKYPLDDIVKQALRKYSKIFIHKKIRLNYNSINFLILTDAKWLTFVVEQILSNALKYTYEGEIFIYPDNNIPDTLVIEDTGIGIEQEDLARVFEKGFTGYNGRTDKKSTGIGLYLTKKILRKLSHRIAIESVVGKGTKVKISFGTEEQISDPFHLTKMKDL